MSLREWWARATPKQILVGFCEAIVFGFCLTSFSLLFLMLIEVIHG